LAALENSTRSSALLSVDRIGSGYGPTQVLFGIEMAVYPGEIVAVIGPNGAGKTTLLNTISGVCRIFSGSISFKGRAITGLRPDQVVNRGIAHSPEGRRVLQRLTVEENLLVAHLPKRSRPFAEMVSEIYSLFPILYERRHSRATRLSGGQQQMLAVGRALMAEPELILLDEPSLGLAPKLVNQILTIILKLAERGITTILVEQNVNLALEISDYAYVVENGTCALEGPSEKLLGDPALKEVYLPKV
jgi:branched-chain amino acid transport system ATP-binding protein